MGAGMGLLGAGLSKVLQPSPAPTPSSQAMNVNSSTDMPSMMTSGGASITGNPVTANANITPLPVQGISQNPNILAMLMAGLKGFGAGSGLGG